MLGSVSSVVVSSRKMAGAEASGSDVPPQRGVRFWGSFLASALVAGALLVGCKTPVREESFVRPFDAQKVAELSHEAYRVAWDANFWARHDLQFAAFHPTVLDREAVIYLDYVSHRLPWLARKVEKNPASPRIASKHTYNMVAYDAMMLRLRYQPTSFTPSTDEKIERLLRLLDEIAPYYAQKQTEGR